MSINKNKQTQPNMSEVMTDPLAENVGSIDTSFPRLIPSNYEMIIDSAEVVPNKRGDGNNLKVTFKTAKDGQSTKGETVSAGVKLTQYIGLSETEKRKNASIKKDIARLAKAAGLSAHMTVRAIIDKASVLNGKTVLCKVGIRQETTEFPESNEVKGIVLEG